MGKRSNFERVERDFYPTPYEAVLPLLSHLDDETFFDEPCAGNGALALHLEKHGHICVWASDIEPQPSLSNLLKIYQRDYRLADQQSGADYFITNPPWDRKLLHPLISFMSLLRPTWLLFDADWIHTKQSSDLMKRCVKIVSVGRVKWIEGSKNTGKDNCCWYLFDSKHTGPTTFVGRS
jgi:hypothetical protein